MSNGMFKCIDCGEKYNHDMASEHDVAICVWCSEPKVGQWQIYTPEDEYADKGMSRSDFIDKEYT